MFTGLKPLVFAALSGLVYFGDLSAAESASVPKNVQPSTAQPQAQPGPAPAPDNAKSAKQPQANQPGKSAPSAPSMADYCRENTC